MKPLKREGGGLRPVPGFQSPTMAGFAASITICPQIQVTDPSYQVLDKKREEKILALVIIKPANCHPQMEKDKGPSQCKSERYGVRFS